MSERFIIGNFDDEEKLVAAAINLKSEGFKIYDFFTPFPVHGLDEILDISRSRLPVVTFFMGLFGLILAIAFQVWTSAFDWPINVGGKPMLSIPAFIPVAFELTILFGALSTVVAFLWKANLFPTKEVNLINIKQTDDLFVIVLENNSSIEDFKKIDMILKNEGALDVRLQA